MSEFNLAKSRKYALIGVFLFVIVLVSLIILAFSQKPSPEQKEAKEITRQELILNLPYFTQDYSIVYSQNKDQIYVNVLRPPYEQNRQRALDWLKKQGADPTKLNISYTPKNKFE